MLSEKARPPGLCRAARTKCKDSGMGHELDDCDG